MFSLSPNYVLCRQRIFWSPPQLGQTIWVEGSYRYTGGRSQQQHSKTPRSMHAGATSKISKGSFTLQEGTCHSLQPNDPKTSHGEKHFSPQESCEIFLKVPSSKWHFWSSQLLGASILLDESNYTHDKRYSQSPIQLQGKLKSNQAFCHPVFIFKTSPKKNIS